MHAIKYKNIHLLYQAASLFLLLWISVIACKNIEDAKPTTRATYLRFVDVNNNIKVTAAVPDGQGGYLVGATIDGLVLDDSKKQDGSLLFSINEHGQLTQTYFYKDASIRSILVEGTSFVVCGSQRVAATATTTYKAGMMMRVTLPLDKNQKIVTYSPRDVLNNSSIADQALSDYTLYTDATISLNADSLFVIGRIKNGTESFKLFNGKVKKSDFSFSPSAYPFLTQSALSEGEVQLDYENLSPMYVVSSTNTTRRSVLWAGNGISENGAGSVGIIPVFQLENSRNYSNSPRIYSEGQANSFTVGQVCQSPNGYWVVGTLATYTNGAESNQNARVLALSPESGIYPAGSIIEGSSFYLNGDTQNPKTATSPFTTDYTPNTGNLIAAFPTGGYVVAGTTNYQNIDGTKTGLLYLTRFDAYGNVVWSTKKGDAENYVQPVYMDIDSQGYITIIGNSTVKQVTGLFILRVDKNGKLE